MSSCKFISGLVFSFGIAWLLMVVVPFFKMGSLTPVAFVEGVDEQTGIYHPKTTGRVVNGEEVYTANGCYQCHTQVVRPTYAGNDLLRPGFGGLKDDPDRGDTRRESNPFDYVGLSFAPIGVERVGPDLMNVGRRMIAEKGADATRYLYQHLYNPRLDPALELWSLCPPHKFLFEERKVQGQRSELALKVPTREGYEIIPNSKARALVSYLLSLQHDDVVPASMNYGGGKK